MLSEEIVKFLYIFNSFVCISSIVSLASVWRVLSLGLEFDIFTVAYYARSVSIILGDDGKTVFPMNFFISILSKIKFCNYIHFIYLHQFGSFARVSCRERHCLRRSSSHAAVPGVSVNNGVRRFFG